MNSATTVDLGAEKRFVTVEAERIFHYISDEELEMMAIQNPGAMSQTCMLALGAALGAVAPAFGAAQQLAAASVPGWEGLAAIAVLVASVPLAVVTAFAWRNESRRVKSMQERIRARHKVPVQTTAALDYP